MRNRILSAWTYCITLFLPAFFCGAAFAQVYDPAADFSPSSNPNGVWTYGWTHTLGGALSLDSAHHDASGLDFWGGGVSTGNAPGFFPYIAHNGTNSAINYGGFLAYPPGQLGMHPGPNGEYSIVRFTALQAVLIDIVGSFFKIDSSATTDVHVLDNGVSIFDGQIGSSTTQPFSLVRNVVGGETIDFAVGYGANDSYFSDSTGLMATIAVPEPGALWLSGAAAAGLAARLRWRGKVWTRVG
jgi:hypothetical protein